MNLVEITIKANDEASDTLSKSESSFDGLGKVAGGAALAVAGAGASSVVGALGIAGIAVGAFAAIAGPELTKVQAAMAQTGAAGKAAFDALTPEEQNLDIMLKNVETAFGQVQTALAPVVDTVMSFAANLAIDLMPALSKLATAGGQVIDDFLMPFDNFVRSASFTQLINQMAQLATQAGSVLGPVLVQLIAVFMKLFVQLAPAGIQIISALGPAFVQLVTALTPVLTVMANVVASVVTFLNNTHLLIPVLGLLAAGLLAASIAGAPIELSVLAIAAAVLVLVGAIAYMATNWTSIWNGIKQITDDVVTAIQSAFDAFMNYIKTGVTSDINDVKSVWDTVWDAIKSAFDTTVSAIKSAWATVESALVSPIESAWNTISGIVNDIKNAISSVTSVINGVVSTAGSILSAVGLASGGIVGAADGGVQSGLRLVGEQGPELVSLPTGSTVYPYSNTAGMLGGGGAQTINLQFSGGQSGFDQFMLQWMRNSVRVQGGGNVQQAFGRV